MIQSRGGAPSIRDERSMAETGNKAVEVEIFGATYPVRAAADREQVLELARAVDRTMRDIAGKVRTTDRSAIAVLAALNGWRSPRRSPRSPRASSWPWPNPRSGRVREYLCSIENIPCAVRAGSTLW